MRDIKFRAWNKLSAHPNMIDVEQLTYDECGGLSHVSGWCVDPDDGGEQTLSIAQFELMQFTGLTDKNGVDIYEGDIVSFHVDWIGQPNKQVIFDKDFHSYVLLSGEEKRWVAKGSNHFKYWSTDEDNIYLLHEADSYDVEVIGNIYENPELLEN
ncbi:MAG: YopX family protein [Gammaproteobacteria bacterium]|nr:YopX family protein [Gammaproteobacteria bacterium]